MPSIEDIKKSKELMSEIHQKKKYDFDIPSRDEVETSNTTDVEIKPVETKSTKTPKSSEKAKVNRNTHDDYIRRSYTLSEDHVRKLRLMKTFSEDTNITYNELIEQSIDLLWKYEYQDKYIRLLKNID